VISGCEWKAGRYRFEVQAQDVEGNLATGGSTAVNIRSRETQRPKLAIFDDSLAPTEPLHVLFNEGVRGIDTDNAFVRAGPGGPRVPGLWVCRDVDTEDVGCVSGAARSATFTPSEPLTPGASYLLKVNPEHRLGVMDLHGNPFRRIREWFWVKSP
jgi:hypothetical protein